MNKVTLRGIFEHKVRFLLSIIAVILGVAFVAGTFSLRTMLSSTFESITATTLQGDIYVRQPAGVTATQSQSPAIPANLAEHLAKIDKIESVIPGVSGDIVLVGKDGTAVSSTQAPVMALMSSEDDRSSKLVAGRMPTKASEISLESATLERSGLKIGDATRVIVRGEIVEVTIVGEQSFNGPLAGATIVFLDEATAMEAFAPEGMVASIELFVASGNSAESVVAEVEAAVAAAQLDPSVRIETGAEAREFANKEINEMLGFIGGFLMVFAAISLFVGAFIISNTFAMTVAARSRELALLRAIGASRLQIFGSVVGQAAVIGVLGSILGVGVGVALVYGLKGVFESMGMALAGDIPLEATTVVISVVCGLLVSIGAAAVPARRAARTSPVEAMRDGVPVPTKMSIIRAVIGIVFVAAGVAMVIYAISQGSEDAMAVYGIGAAATLIGILVSAPAIAPALTYILGWPFAMAIKPMGRLARGNVSRNPKRPAATASALVIGMALVGAASVIAASVSTSVESLVADEMNSDFLIMAAGGQGVIPEGVTTAVQEREQIASVDTLITFIHSVDGEMEPVRAIDPSALGRSMQPLLESGKLGLDDDTVLVQSWYATEQGTKIGDSLTLGERDGSTVVTVGGIVNSRLLGGAMVVSEGLMEQISTPIDRLFLTGLVTVRDGVSEAEARTVITEAVAPYIVVSVYDSEQYTSNMTDQVNQVLTILYALLGLSIVIAVLGIVNTLTLSVMERTREIGLLRAVGLGRLQMAATITIESVLISIFGAALGLIVGVGLGSALPSIMVDTGLTTLTIPWGELGVMVVIAAVVGVLAAVWPAIRAARLPVLEAIATD